MRLVGYIAAFSMLALGAGVAGTQSLSKLEGSYALWGKTLIDPPEHEQLDRVILVITGKAAKDVFEAMPGAGVRQECGDVVSGAFPRWKVAGGLRCTRIAEAEFQCTVAIVLATGATASGEDPC